MFEAQVAYYLNAYLGKYVHGLDAQALRISVWQGDVELRNLQLKPEALQDLQLPITVKSGLLGRLTLKARERSRRSMTLHAACRPDRPSLAPPPPGGGCVRTPAWRPAVGVCALQVPWARLGQDPVIAEFDRLYIVACPRSESEAAAPAAPAPTNPAQQEAAMIKAEQDAKRRRVAAAEQAWTRVRAPAALPADPPPFPRCLPCLASRTAARPALCHTVTGMHPQTVTQRGRGWLPGPCRMLN
jgi:vacuolar protein sorting-associated protein 13A/C